MIQLKIINKKMINNIFKIDIPAPVRLITEKLNLSGYSAYPVGGCIRDSVLGAVPKDWDIATSAMPNEVIRALPEYKVIETGIAHGTVTVISGGQPYEVTTFRTDGKYSDNRRPDYVEFVSSLSEDLSRRDFTVNAMAYDCKSDKIIDLFGGVDDLKNNILRCVGEPSERFNEDSLRILRGLRFASVYGLEIEAKTKQATHDCRRLLKNVSCERIFDELKRIICGQNAEKALREYRDVFAVIIPELEPMFDFPQKNPYHRFDVWEHTIHAVSEIEPLPVYRLVMLFHDIGKPLCHTSERLENGTYIDHFYTHAIKSEELAKTILRRLKSDNRTLTTAAFLIKAHGDQIEPSKKSVKRKLGKIGEDMLRMLIKVKKADVSAQASEYMAERLKLLDEIERLIDEIVAENECFSVKDLAIDGNDVIRLGFSGPDIGKILNAAVDEIINENLMNNKNDIISFITHRFGV